MFGRAYSVSCFLRFANLPHNVRDRLSRYEATLWRQAGQILFPLDASDRNCRTEEVVSKSAAARTADLRAQMSVDFEHAGLRISATDGVRRGSKSSRRATGSEFTRWVHHRPCCSIQDKALIAISESRKSCRNLVRYPVNAGLTITTPVNEGDQAPLKVC